jgi:3-methyladenine DNA glycosylase AlkD
LRRISNVSTFEFIGKHKFDFAYKIAELLLGDNEDMVQKAVGWMLREIGKRDKNSEINFLILHREVIPPKVMRYALENFNSNEKDLLKKFS